MKKLKIAIVGCGAVAHRWYLRGLTGSTKKNYTVQVVCDMDTTKAMTAQQQYNISEYCTTFDEVLKKDIDIAVILTRHHQHYEHCKFFLEHGVHVYSEKPITENVEQAEHLAQIASKNELYIACAPQIMLSSRNKKVKQLIEDGILGKVVYVRCSGSNLGPAARKDTDYDPIRFYQNGGSLDSLGIYNIATILRRFGEPERICAYSGIAIPHRKVLYGPAVGKSFAVTAPDNVVAMLEYKDAMYVTCDASYTIPNPPKYDFEIHGELGSLFVGGFGGKKSVLHKDPLGQARYVGPDDRKHKNRNLSWGVEELVNAIIHGIEPTNGITYGIAVVRTLQRIKTAAQEHIYT